MAIGNGGCSDFKTTAAVTVANTPSTVISYPLICSSDGIINVQLTGTPGGSFSTVAGLNLNATTGAITPSLSTPGTYMVKYHIAASAPCFAFDTSTSVTITKAPSAAISYNVSTLCNVVDGASTPNPPVTVKLTGTSGGVFTITPASGLPINPTTGTLIPSGATPGTYTISYTIPASGGCSEYKASDTVIITGASVASVSYSGSPFCTGTNTLQPVTIDGTKGGIFTSSPVLSIDSVTGMINPSLSKPGAYTITYTIPASAPCPGFITTTTVTINESPVITFPVSTQSVCSDETAVFKPSSTVSNTVYTWSVTNTLPPTITGITSGTVSGPNAAINLLFKNTGSSSETVTVRVKSSNPVQSSCAGVPYELTLIVHPIPRALQGDTTQFCMHQPPMPLVAHPDNGDIVHWYDSNMNPLDSAPVINTIKPATFVFYATQTNQFGCEGPASRFVAVVHPVAKIVSSSYTNPTACGLPTGSITLNVLDLNNDAILNIPVIVHYTKFQVNYTIAGNTGANGRITIPLTAGTYSAIFVETYGCFSQKIPDVFVLKDPDPPAQPFAGYNAPVCSETVLNLTASSPTSSQQGLIKYVWAGPAFGNLPDTTQNTVFSFPSAKTSYNGIYIVYAIQNNCISTPAAFPVEIKQSPVKPVIITKTPLCIGDALTLQARSSIPGNSTLNYVWKGSGSGFPINAPNAGINSVKIEDGGIYSITVSSPATGCSSTSDTLIQVGAYPIAKFAQDSLNFPTGHILHLTPTIENASEPNVLPIKKYEWTPAENIVCNDAACSLPTITVRKNICYTVKATNIYGCSGSDSICITTFCKNSQVFVPNAFTPRGLAVNSRFMVRASGIASVKAFRVFNRWGRIVFERNNFPPNDPAYGWDGYINGKIADMGVYVFIVDVVCENGTPYAYKGNVTLLQ